MPTDSGRINERVRLYRTSSGLSQAALAEKADLHTTYIGQIERGEKNPTIETLLKITDALAISPDEFFAHLSGFSPTASIAEECYQLLLGLSAKDQEYIRDIIQTIIKIKES